jgi:hypothetical protein
MSEDKNDEVLKGRNKSHTLIPLFQDFINKLESIPVALPQAIKSSPLWGFFNLLFTRFLTRDMLPLSPRKIVESVGACVRLI